MSAKKKNESAPPQRDVDIVKACFVKYECRGMASLMAETKMSDVRIASILESIGGEILTHMHKDTARLFCRYKAESDELVLEVTE